MYTRNDVCLYETMCTHLIDMDLCIYMNMIFTTKRTGIHTLNVPNKTEEPLYTQMHEGKRTQPWRPNTQQKIEHKPVIRSTQVK